MKKYLMLIVLSALIFTWSCNKNDNEDGVSMEFKETNCANPWEAAPGSENYITEVSSYLEINGITVYTIFIERFELDPGEVCQACNCLTGRKIVISIPNSEIDKAEAEGFTPQTSE